MRTTLTTRAMRCLRHGGGAAAFWSLTLFASQASLDAYRATSTVLSADKAAAKAAARPARPAPTTPTSPMAAIAITPAKPVREKQA